MKIVGQAVSGIGSALALPDIGVCLDIGVCTPEAIECQTVLITHGHQDHLHGIVQHALIRGMQRKAPPSYVMLPHLIPQVEALFEVWKGIQEEAYVPRFTLVPLAPGGEFPLGRGWFARSYKTDHRIPSQGYSIFERREKLKPEFVGREGKEIGALRLAGTQVTERCDVLHLTYPGDTRCSIIEVEDIRKAQTLVIESTFLCDETAKPGFAQERGHIHLQELEAQAERFENKRILLVHFSARYDDKIVAERLMLLPPALKGRVAFLSMGA